MVEDSIALDNLREQAARGGTLKKVTRARRKLRSIDKRVETGKRKFIDAARSYAASFPASLQEYVEHGTEDGYLNRFILADLVAPSPLVKLSSPLPSSPNRQKLHGRKPQPYLAQLRATSAAQESNRWISKATLFGIQESSRAEYLWRETRDDKVRDLEIFRYLAGLFGPLETSIFSASLFPGESYRCLVHAAASKIQSWWRPFPNYLHNLRHSAASLIQKRARIAAMRRKNNEYDRIVRRCLGRMMHRQLSATFESWKGYYEQQKRFKARLRKIFGELKLSCFSAWAKYTRNQKIEQRLRYIRACAAILNRKLYISLQSWKAFTWHRKAAIRIQTLARAHLARVRASEMRRIKHQEQTMRRCVAKIMHRHMSSTFLNWKQVWVERRGMRRILKRMLHRSMVGAFEAWRDFLEARRSLRNKLSKLLGDIKTIYFTKWKEEAVFRRKQRLERLYVASKRMYNRRLVPVMNSWKDYAYKRVFAREMMQRAFRLTTHDCFRRWHMYAKRKHYRYRNRPLNVVKRIIGWVMGKKGGKEARKRLSDIDTNRAEEREKLWKIRKRQR